jgi:hypothetical protein
MPKQITTLNGILKFMVKEGEKIDKKVCAYNMECSQAVTHPSTDSTQRCLTSVIGREPVCST